MENSFIIIGFGLIGLFLGSLFTYLAHRIPLVLLAQQQKKDRFSSNQRGELANKYSYDISFSLSHPICPDCVHRLRQSSIIPIYSWWKRQRQCEYCQWAISFIYPLAELITAFLFMVLAGSNQNLPWLLILLFITSLLITAILIDMAYQLLPDILTFPLICTGLLAALSGYSSLTFLESLSGALFGYLLLWLPAVVFTTVKGVEGLGQGDMKLLAGLGAWLGAGILPTVIFIACLSALGFMLLTYGYKRSKNKRIAFGPFLAITGWLALLKDPFMIDLSILLRDLL